MGPYRRSTIVLPILVTACAIWTVAVVLFVAGRSALLPPIQTAESITVAGSLLATLLGLVRIGYWVVRLRRAPR